jgi:predicted metal-dependent HD superfamily phosphohydrolase
VPEEIRGEVGRLVRLTAHHTVAPGDKLGAILISIDLSTLGGAPGDYDAYAQAIRREYAHVPDAAYRAGRAAVLERFLARAAIFPDATFAERYEARARENIAREIAALRA